MYTIGIDDAWKNMNQYKRGGKKMTKECMEKSFSHFVSEMSPTGSRSLLPELLSGGRGQVFCAA